MVVPCICHSANLPSSFCHRRSACRKGVLSKSTAALTCQVGPRLGRFAAPVRTFRFMSQIAVSPVSWNRTMSPREPPSPLKFPRYKSAKVVMTASRDRWFAGLVDRPTGIVVYQVMYVEGVDRRGLGIGRSRSAQRLGERHAASSMWRIRRTSKRWSLRLGADQEYLAEQRGIGPRDLLALGGRHDFGAHPGEHLLDFQSGRADVAHQRQGKRAVGAV